MKPKIFTFLEKYVHQQFAFMPQTPEEVDKGTLRDYFRWSGPFLKITFAIFLHIALQFVIKVDSEQKPE